MSNPIQLMNFMPGVSSIGAALPNAQSVPADAPKGKDFKSILLDSLDEVNRLQQEADQGVQRLMTGETDNVAEVFTAVNKAGIAFDLLMEVRNKLVTAYEEIKQMRV